MQVVMIGTGNVATVLAKRLFAKGYLIKEVFGKTHSNALVLAEQVQATAIQHIHELSSSADIYIIAVADKAIEPIVAELQLEGKLLLHTAGSVPIDVLKKASSNYGVLYPIQSIRKDMDDATAIPFLIDGASEQTKQAIITLASSMGQKTWQGNDEQRLKLHVAAVFACNFVNYMYLQSARFCEAENINFSMLQSLIEETALRLHKHHPAEVFTGPAVRKDMLTIEKHLSILKPYPAMQALYETITHNILGENN